MVFNEIDVLINIELYILFFQYSTIMLTIIIFAYYIISIFIYIDFKFILYNKVLIIINKDVKTY